MLLILTGDVEIGKTTWLMRAVDALTDAGVRCDGVVAPGVWERREDESLDKLGISNVLLPQRKIVPFARRADLAHAEGAFDPEAQAAKAGLKWHISDEAIRIVNRHFDALDEEVRTSAETYRGERQVLVVDELGQLELLRNEGLTSAVSMLEAGPRGVYAHAIIIARNLFGLVEAAERRFAQAWGGAARIAPDDQTWNTWIAPLLK